MRRLSGALASRNFRLLVACDVTSMTGTWMAAVAVPFAVLRAGGSATDIGFVSASGMVATITFLLFGGVISDRLPRQQVMVAANLAQAMTQAGFAVLVLTGEARLWEMMALAAARGCANGFYLPAAQGLLPQTVTADQLSSANAIARMSLNAAQIAGAAFGGAVVSLVGPGWGLVADASSYALAAALRAGMRLGALPPAQRSGFASELRDGWRQFTSRRWLWSLVVQLGLVNAIFVGGFMVLGPVVADHRLGGAASWGLVLAAYSAGAVAGAALMVRYRPARLLLTGSLVVPAMALPLLALAVPLDTGVIAAAALLAGAGSTMFDVNWNTAIQEQIPTELLSRVSSYDALGSYALGPLGTTLAGPAALLFGLTATLAGGGILIVASSLCVLCIAEVRQLTRRAARGVRIPSTAVPPPDASANRAPSS